MKIITISGSIRNGSMTKKTILELNKFFPQEIEIENLDLAKETLVFAGQGESCTKFQERMQSADAFIFATPEYNGSYSALLKLFIENMNFPSVLANKPVALIGVAAGALGATKSLEHLTSVCHHLDMYTLPRVLSIANVYEVFDKKGNLIDQNTKRRLEKLAKDFVNFVRKVSK